MPHAPFQVPVFDFNMVVFVKTKASDKTFTNMSDDDNDERHFSDEDENWTKLQDIASRRRIQNRISQRKRSTYSPTLDIVGCFSRRNSYLAIEFPLKDLRITN